MNNMYNSQDKKIDLQIKKIPILLEEKNFDKLKSIFEFLIEVMPNERLGYIGMALYTYANPNIRSKEYITYINYAKKAECSLKYKEYCDILINYNKNIYAGNTLLMKATKLYLPKTVQALIDMGADVNIRSYSNATALWYISHTALNKEKYENGIKIAEILINNNAEIDVVNNINVSLFSEKTDPKIAELIKNKYPNAEPVKSTSAKETKVSVVVPNFSKTLAILLLVSFSIYAVLTGKIFSGVILGFISAAIGFCIGLYLENKIKDSNGKLKEKIKGYIVVFVAVMFSLGILSLSIGSISSSSGKKWGDLSKQEQDNAKWAYYAQQVINERK